MPDAGPLARQFAREHAGTNFRLGPFAVDPHGRMCPDPAEGARFRFQWRERDIAAELHRGKLVLTALVGRVPSSAGAATARPGAFAAVAELPALVPANWQLRLRPDHRVELAWSAPLDGPLHAPGLLALLTGFLIDSAPYFDLLDESGIGPAGAEPGSARV